MRILVTGSRNWADQKAVDQAIREAVGHEQVVTIIHGGCPTGADWFAAKWAAYWDVYEESYPADWTRRGKAAGPIRNQQMVDSGADVCLAFPLADSRGTRDCMRRAAAAGIRVVNLGVTR